MHKLLHMVNIPSQVEEMNSCLYWANSSVILDHIESTYNECLICCLWLDQELQPLMSKKRSLDLNSAAHKSTYVWRTVSTLRWCRYTDPVTSIKNSFLTIRIKIVLLYKTEFRLVLKQNRNLKSDKREVLDIPAGENVKKKKKNQGETLIHLVPFFITCFLVNSNVCI